MHLRRAVPEIGLISDTGHAQPNHIRYMCTHASAAHPDEDRVVWPRAGYMAPLMHSAGEITLPVPTVTADTGELLRDIKETRSRCS